LEEPRPDVIRAAAAGDVAAFESLVRLYSPQLWRFLRRMLGDAMLAEDVAQETFVRVHRNLSGFAFESKFSTWVFRVARNAALDALRRETRRRRLTAILPARGVTAPPDAAVELQQAVQELPPLLREALLTVEVLGLTYREAADMLGAPEGTVKSRVFHARARLVAWLDAGEQAREV